MSHDLYLLLYGPESLNHRLFLLLNHASAPLLDTIMPLFTYLGGAWAIYAYLPLLLAVSLRWGELLPRRYVWLYCLATFIGLGCENLLKELFQVPRRRISYGLEVARLEAPPVLGSPDQVHTYAVWGAEVAGVQSGPSTVQVRRLLEHHPPPLELLLDAEDILHHKLDAQRLRRGARIPLRRFCHTERECLVGAGKYSGARRKCAGGQAEHIH